MRALSNYIEAAVKKMTHAMTQPLFRLLITPVRGGSSAFLRTFENNPHVHGVHQPIKSGLREIGIPDYSIYQPSHPIYHQYPGKFIVAKETIGPFEEECTFNLFPDDSAVQISKPLFMFRDPFQTWNSWKKFGRENYQTGLNRCCTSYLHTYKLFENALQISSDVTCITLEKLGKNPAKMFQYICQRWEIPYEVQMLNWSISLGENTTFTNYAKNLLDQHPAWIKSVEQVRESTTFNYRPLKSEELAIGGDEIEIITQKLLPSYQEISQLAKIFYP